MKLVYLVVNDSNYSHTRRFARTQTGKKGGQQFIPGKGMRAREDFQLSGITNFQQPSKVRSSFQICERVYLVVNLLLIINTIRVRS